MSSTETPVLPLPLPLRQPPPPPPPTPALKPTNTPATSHQPIPQTSSLPSIPKSTHLQYLRQTINLAAKSPPKPTNFRVGCVIVSYPNLTASSSSSSTTTTTFSSSSSSSPTAAAVVSHTLSTGYTLELPGNTHAEQCALSKLTLIHPPSSSSSSSSNPHIPHLAPSLNTILYTSLEPCSVRLSGNTACVQHILATRQDNNPHGGIRKVVFGAKEPGTFVRDSQACRLLTDAGVECEYIPDLEAEILRVAMEGHAKKEDTDVSVSERDAVRSEPENGSGQLGGDGNKETRIDDITDEERRRQEALPRNPKKRMMELEPGAGK